MSAHTLASLEQLYPWVEWRKPLRVNDYYYACRVCIANDGLRGSDLSKLPTAPGDIERHIATEHA